MEQIELISTCNSIPRVDNSWGKFALVFDTTLLVYPVKLIHLNQIRVVNPTNGSRGRLNLRNHPPFTYCFCGLYFII